MCYVGVYVFLEKLFARDIDFRLNDIFLDLINVNDKNRFYGMEV